MDKILIAFANSAEDPLLSLKEEDDGLYSLLNRTLSENYTILRESHATKESLVRQVRDSKDELCLFLYSGHAGNEELLLDDEKAGAEGLANLLKLCPKLKLVVLNGCNTQGHVERLLELGVPAIIATNQLVGDTKAVQFSKVLFEKLANLSSIESAFEEAKSAVWSEDRNIEIHRGLSGDWMTGGNSQKDLWGLFTTPEKEAVLNWKLRRTSGRVDPDFVPNATLIAALIEGLARYRKDAKSILDKEADGDICSDRKKRDVIFTSLPEPIGDHFKKLMIAESDNSRYSKPGLGRLGQLIVAYNAVTEFIALVFLTQLWELAANENVELKPDELQEIRSFLINSEEGSEKYDYTGLIYVVRLILSRYGMTYFVPELEGLAKTYAENVEMKEAVGFLEDVKSQLVDKSVTETDAGSMTALAEQHLATFVKEIGFLTNYDLTSIKRVDVYKYRHLKKAKYKYQYVLFEQSSGGIGNETETKSFVMDGQSVLITKPDSDGEYLNLSPFIIDENAFDSMASINSLLAFRYYDRSEDVYYFKSIYRPNDPLLEIDGRGEFKVIAEQYEAFAKLIFNKSMREL
jgi:CHAT domain-containing protein